MRQIFKTIVKASYLLSKWTAVCALMAIVLFNCANMASRWLTGSPFEWVLELSLILFVYAVMLIFPVIHHDKAFIRMHLVEEIIGPRRAAYVNTLADTLILAFAAYLLYQGLALSFSQMHILSRGLGIPRIYVTIPVSIGAALGLPIGLDILLRDLGRIINQDWP